MKHFSSVWSALFLSVVIVGPILEWEPSHIWRARAAEKNYYAQHLHTNNVSLSDSMARSLVQWCFFPVQHLPRGLMRPTLKPLQLHHIVIRHGSEKRHILNIPSR